MAPANQKPRISIGRAVVPIQFGEQVIVSILYNHDANPVHHRPDMAVQWMLGLLAAQGVGGAEGGLESAGPEQRTYALGTRLLAGQDIVIMPGIVLAAICYERFISPFELTASVETTFTYPLLVPTKGAVEVTMEAFELPEQNGPDIPGRRNVLIEAYGPGITGAQVRLIKIEAEIYREGTSRDLVYERAVKPRFEELHKQAPIPGMSELSHRSSISHEDVRRYRRIIELAPTIGTQKIPRPITESAWQCKIPRVLTEVIDHLRINNKYQAEVSAYYAGRDDEAGRLEAIARYVQKERKYGWLKEGDEAPRIQELSQITQQLYARQRTVFDPRQFKESSPATMPGTIVQLDLHLSEMRLRRGIHRFLTQALFDKTPIFMGEATVTAQPLVTRELANFLCEVNHAFNTLKLLKYKGLGD